MDVYEQLKFLRPVMATTKSRDSISTQNNDLDDSVSLPDDEPPLKKKSLKTTIAERRLELLAICAESMAPGSSAKQPTHFALLVKEKLGRLSQRKRVIARESWIFCLRSRSTSLKEEFIKLWKLINYPLSSKSTSKSTCITYESTYFNLTQCKSTLSKQK